MKTNLFTMLAILFSHSCIPEKNQALSFAGLTPYSLKQRQTEITLLRSFIINKECDGISKYKFADVFVSKVNNTNDTILVFSICKKTFPFLKNDYKGPRWLVIDSAKVSKDFPNEIITSIDKMEAKKYKFVVAEINNLDD